MNEFEMTIKVPAKIHDALMDMSDFARERFIIEALEERMKDFTALAEKLTESPNKKGRFNIKEAGRCLPLGFFGAPFGALFL